MTEMDKKVRIKVDGKEIEANEQDNLLRVCLENDIYIPNLCYMEGMDAPPVSCRLCFVEIEGRKGTVSSCTVKVSDGLTVYTDTDEVRRLQRTALEFLLSTHRVDCAHCPANKKCEIQKLARFLKVGLKSEAYNKYLKQNEVDDTHPKLNYYPNRCVLCGRCVYVCRGKDKSVLSFARRGLETVISFYGQEESLTCDACGECVKVCPVKALTLKEGDS